MRHLIIITIVATCIAGAGNAQTTPPSTSAFDVDGIKVIFKPTVKQIINVSVYFRGGVTNYPGEKAGIEKMALDGTLNCGAGAYTAPLFKEKMDAIGARLTAVADMDNGRIGLNCVARYFNDGWDLLASAVAKPVFDETSFGIMREKHLGELQSEEGNPDRSLRLLALAAAFKGTPYSTNPEGSKASLAALTPAEVKQYYTGTLLNKSRMFIVVVGNVTKEDITAKIHAAFGHLPAGSYTPQLVQTPAFGSTPVAVEERAIPTNYILGIVNAPAYGSADYVPFLLAFSELHGLLFSEIRIKRHLSYAPDADLHASLMPYADVYVSTTDPKASVAVMNDVLGSMKSNKIANRSLDQIKALFITSNYRRQESTDALADMLGRAETLGGWQIAESLPNIIQQTTRKQMAAAFGKYVSGVSWAYLGDKAKADEAMPAFNRPIN